MILNDYSYAHKKIRKRCEQLELISGLKLITDLNDYIVELRFMNKLSYIVINWRKKTVFTLSHKLNDVELALIDELMIELDWLETGENIRYLKKGGK